MPDHIEKRRRKWYAVYDVPKDVRDEIGLRRFVKSLDTDSRSVALRRAAPLVAQWKAQIQAARTGSRDGIDQDIEFWRNALKGAATYSEEEGDLSERDLILDSLIEEAEVKERREEGSGVEFFNRATGKTIGLTEYVDEWIGLLEDTPKTKDMKRSFVFKFAEDFPTLDTVTKPKVKLWVGRQRGTGLTLSTIKRQLSFIRSYWEHLTTMELVSEENRPLWDLRLGKAARNANPGTDTKPFSPDQVTHFLALAKEKGDDQLADLIALGMWSGCRIEELCSLKVDQVTDDSFNVVDAKTPSGWRTVPIHSTLKPTMTRLIDASEDGYVMSGLSPNKYGDRSNAIGKRFGRLKRGEGFADRSHVYHSIRKTVASAMKNSGVPEAVAADILGHDHDTMTYGLYTGDTPLEVMKEAIERIGYPRD